MHMLYVHMLTGLIIGLTTVSLGFLTGIGSGGLFSCLVLGSNLGLLLSALSIPSVTPSRRWRVVFPGPPISGHARTLQPSPGQEESSASIEGV